MCRWRFGIYPETDPPIPLREPRPWFSPQTMPGRGDWCACCKGRHFWNEATAPKGWRCWDCRPPLGLVEPLREVRT